MKSNLEATAIISWLFGALVATIGVLNLILVHPVPGIVYLLFVLIYLPPVNNFLKQRFGIAIPVAVKIILGIVLLWFTLGISDLGDMID